MNKENKGMLFSIRNKVIACFLVPVLFMIVIGVTAYLKSAAGMSEKYLESTQQTIQMAGEYVDMSCSFVEAEALKYAYDKELSRYFLGMYNSDLLARTQYIAAVKTNILASQTANPFISNIHIVPQSGNYMITTNGDSNVDGFFEEYRASVAAGNNNFERWVDGHDLLDETFHLSPSEYIMSCQFLSQSSNACVVIDIKASTIQGFLEGLNLGEGSIIGFVTKDGREILYENLAEGKKSTLVEGESVFFGQSFFPVITENSDSNTMQGTYETKFRGGNWQFMYYISEKTGAVVCALVPSDVIIGQAREIRNITVALVVLACVAALVIGLMTVAGIQNNIAGIFKKFGEVAQGDLTVQVQARGRDEFRGLASSANYMIGNTKKLVQKVKTATGHLEDSAQSVEQASGVIGEYSLDITRAIDEINTGIDKQSEHAQECVQKTDVLSSEIQEVSRGVEEVSRLVQETEDRIDQGMEIIQLLGSRARETASITSKVGESIESLRRESETINSFVETITAISEQTNLLSLNASIEAARAGETGRGFAVVAEEIRKLADDSAKAAGEISVNVEHITAQTMNSVESAKEAQDMVAAQSEAVDQAVGVFQEMQQRMDMLVEGLGGIVDSTRKADQERSSTVNAVQNISDIIEQTAHSAESVRDIVRGLMESVENLNGTADNLGDNMESLKSEISLFKI